MPRFAQRATLSGGFVTRSSVEFRMPSGRCACFLVFGITCFAVRIGSCQPSGDLVTPSAREITDDAYVARMKAAGIQPTVDSIARYLESLLPSPRRIELVENLIRQLGSSSFSQRQQATIALAALRNPPFGKLRGALASDDLEIQMRASRLLKLAESKLHTSELVAVLTTIERRQLKGLARLLLKLIPHWDTQAYQLPARRAIAMTCREEDHDALRAALGQGNFDLRMASITALAALLGPCANDQMVDILDDYDDRIRLAAAQVLADLGRPTCLSTLALLSRSGDSQVANVSRQILSVLLGEQLANNPQSPTALAEPFPMAKLWKLLEFEKMPRIRYPARDLMYATWVWQQKGEVGFQVEGRMQLAKRISDLPWGKLRLVRIDLSGTQVNTLHLDRLSDLRDVTELDLSNCSRLERNAFSRLGHFGNLRHLNLKDTEFLDQDAWHLKHLASLESLILEGTAVTDSGLSAVAMLPSLETLHLGRFVSDAGLAKLTNLTQLRRIHLHYNTRVSNQSLRYLSQLSSLSELSLYRCREISDDGLKPLARLGNLHSLTLICPGVTDRGLHYVARIPSLRHLDLYTSQITGSTLGELSRLPNLESLNLARTQLDDTGIQNLPSLPNLRYLNLSFTHITDRGLRSVGHLPRLQQLILVNGNLTGNGLEHLREAQSLEVLDLHNASLNARLDSLGHLSSLRKLDLGNTEVSNQTLAVLQNLKHLEELNISRNLAISDECIRHLVGLQSLRAINIRQTRVTSEGRRRLQTSLPRVSFVGG